MEQIKKTKPTVMLAALMLTSMLLASCAGTAGSRSAVKPMEDSSSLSRYSTLVFDAKGAPGVPIYPQSINIIVNTILGKIREHELNHFKAFDDERKDGLALQASLLFTRYEKGNKWARFWLAGLGQIHIDAVLSLRDIETQELLGEYKVSKTFAWGGMYGASVTMADVQEGFAETVVAILFQPE